MSETEEKKKTLMDLIASLVKAVNELVIEYRLMRELWERGGQPSFIEEELELE